MRVTVASVGRLGASSLADAVREHERRAGRYWRLECVETRQEPARSIGVEAVREREWGRVRGAVPESAVVVVCDERGRSMTSEDFAAWLDDRRQEGRDVAFVIGGAFGLPPEARASAGLVLALAPWTLSHDLARLVLAEQLYRAGTILRGEPYHK